MSYYKAGLGHTRVGETVATISPIEQNALQVKHSNTGVFVVLGLCAGILAIGKFKPS